MITIPVIPEIHRTCRFQCCLISQEKKNMQALCLFSGSRSSMTPVGTPPIMKPLGAAPGSSYLWTSMIFCPSLPHHFPSVTCPRYPHWACVGHTPLATSDAQQRCEDVVGSICFGIPRLMASFFFALSLSSLKMRGKG